MNTEYQIRADYNSANRAADELEDIAGSLIRLADSGLDGAFRTLENSWRGENAERFINKGSIVREQILGTAKDIRNAAERLRSDARSVYQAEMRALEIARRRAEQEKAAEKNSSVENGGYGGYGGGGGGSR